MRTSLVVSLLLAIPLVACGEKSPSATPKTGTGSASTLTPAAAPPVAASGAVAGPSKNFMSTLRLGTIDAKLNRPVRVLDDGTMRAPKPEVVIYYAVESAPDADEAASIERTRARLRALNDPAADRVAANAELNVADFPRAVDEDVRAILDAPTDAIVFTNRTARAGEIVAKRGGETRRVRFAVAPTEDVVGRSQPLGRPEGFAAAVRIVVEQFPSNDFDYVWIVKSHGGGGLVATSSLYARLGDVPQAAFDTWIGKVRAFSAQTWSAGTLSEQVENGSKEQFPILSNEFDDLLSPTLRDAMRSIRERALATAFAEADAKLAGPRNGASAPRESLDAWLREMEAEHVSPGEAGALPTPRLGIGAAELFQAIRLTGAFAPTVFLESCHSEINAAQLERLRAQKLPVGWLHTSDVKGLHFRTIDYATVANRVRTDGIPFSQALHDALDKAAGPTAVVPR